MFNINNRRAEYFHMLSGCVVLCIAALSPLACYKHVQLSNKDEKPLTAADIARCKAAAQREAEIDWNRGEAVLFHDDKVAGSFDKNGITYAYSYDRNSGIGIVPSIHPAFATQRSRIHEVAYTEKVREVLKKRGIPKWSKKAELVPPEVLLKYLDLKNIDDKERVKRFPIQFGKSMVLKRKSGSAIEVTVKAGERVVLEDKATGTFTEVVRDEKTTWKGRGGEPVSVYRSRRFPKVIMIRIGNTRMIALNKDGHLRGTAARTRLLFNE